MRNAKIETLCFNAQLYSTQLYISQFPSFPFFVISGRPFFNVNKNLGKPILEILLIFLHSFMVNQNEKWWHIQLFLLLNHFFFFVWSKLAQFGGTVSRRERGRDRHPKGCSSFCLFNSTKDHHSRDSITNEKKTKRIFLVLKFPVYFNPKKYICVSTNFRFV